MEIDEEERIKKEKLARKKEIRNNLTSHIINLFRRMQEDDSLVKNWVSIILLRRLFIKQ